MKRVVVIMFVLCFCACEKLSEHADLEKKIRQACLVLKIAGTGPKNHRVLCSQTSTML